MIYILDLDGTLIDSRERHCRLMQEILSEAAPETVSGRVSGKRFDPAEFMRYKADGYNGLRYLTDRLELAEDTAYQIMALWQQQIEEERWLKLDVLYPDTLVFLNRLKQKHRKIYYLTARKNKEGLLRELERLKIADYAAEIKIVSPSGAREEKKRVVEDFLTKAGEDAGSVCIVGDTENEYYLAKELSLPCFLLNRGFRSERYWKDRGVESLSSLYEIEKNCVL
ncbi:MAG: HAD hydrolase-like protein [Lachnospiraceae bacterium]|nr:HAD hydrolase-like protein [Lachnospiraceae bacterium]